MPKFQEELQAEFQIAAENFKDAQALYNSERNPKRKETDYQETHYQLTINYFKSEESCQEAFDQLAAQFKKVNEAYNKVDENLEAVIEYGNLVQSYKETIQQEAKSLSTFWENTRKFSNEITKEQGADIVKTYQVLRQTERFDKLAEEAREYGEETNLIDKITKTKEVILAKEKAAEQEAQEPPRKKRRLEEKDERRPLTPSILENSSSQKAIERTSKSLL